MVVIALILPEGTIRRSFWDCGLKRLFSAGHGKSYRLSITSLKGVAGNMATGKVKWFNDQKGFGFIATEHTGKDVFVHHSVIEGDGYKTLEDGESVEYEAESSDKGLKATKVRRSVTAQTAAAPAAR